MKALDLFGDNKPEAEKPKANKKLNISESRATALEKIKQYLSVENVEDQFVKFSGNYYSGDKFIVTWYGTYHGMTAEYKLEKVDAFYQTYSGYCCIYGTAGLFHEKQFKGYRSFERGLIDVGMRLCPNKMDMMAFFEKYAVPYNNRLKQKENEQTGNA